MATITIQDEATRRALLFALWKRACRAAEAAGGINEVAYTCACVAAGLPSDADQSAEFDRALATITAARNAVDTVRATAVGDEVAIAEEGLAEGLDDVRRAIADYEGLAALTERDLLLAVHDAAARLLDELHVEAVA